MGRLPSLSDFFRVLQEKFVSSSSNFGDERSKKATRDKVLAEWGGERLGTWRQLEIQVSAAMKIRRNAGGGPIG